MAKQDKHLYRIGIAAIVGVAVILLFGIGYIIYEFASPNPGQPAPRAPYAEQTDVCLLGSPIIPETTVAEGWDENPEEILNAIATFAAEAGVTNGMPQTEAIGKINDYLCEKIVYGESKYCRTIRGPLIQRQAVCVGYALAFQYIAQYCGIDAVYVHGYTKATAHGWNGVYFSDGTYLEVDVTMNDTGGDFDKYLLITPKEMERLHFS